MKKQYLTTCLCFFFTLSLSAQSSEIVGLLLDQNSDEPIPYASVRLAETGLRTISNSFGEFSLTIPQGTVASHIEISSLGYADQKLALSLFVSGEKKIIYLREQAFTLEEVVIYSSDITARQMLTQAFKHIKDNYPQEDYLLHTFYRHYCKEEGVYGRLIEAAIDLYDKQGYKKPKRDPSKKFEVALKQLRKSIDFTSLSGFSHSPISLFQTLGMDRMAYKRFPISLLREDRYKLDIAFHDTTYYQGKVVYILRCTTPYTNRPYSLDIYISADDFAILRVEEQRAYTSTYKQRRSLVARHEIVTYQFYQGHYYPEYLLHEGQQTTDFLDSLGTTIQTTNHFYHIELMVNQIETSGFKRFKGGEPTHEQMAVFPYDQGFWKNYTVLKATPLEQDIQQDLAARVSLEDQFSGYNQQGKLLEIQDQLMTARLDNLMKMNAGRPVLLCFWDSGYKPGLKDLLFARKFTKKYSDAKLSVGLIFISLDKSEVEWNQTIKKYRLYAGQHLRLAKGLQAAIARSYGVTGSPYFVLFDTKQRTILQGSELPKRSKIDELMQEMVK